MKKVAIIHGPNMSQLGKRETHIYGTQSLEDLQDYLFQEAQALQLELLFYQSNHEGDLIDYIEELFVHNKAQALIINPAAYSHTSIALSDALTACKLPAIEVHLSNIFARESFRNTSYTARACIGSITGLGFLGYSYALKFLASKLRELP